MKTKRELIDTSIFDGPRYTAHDEPIRVLIDC